MAESKVIGKVVTKASFSVDSKGLANLKKFEKRLDDIKKKMDGLGGVSSSSSSGNKSPKQQTKVVEKQAKAAEKARKKATDDAAKRKDITKVAAFRGKSDLSRLGASPAELNKFERRLGALNRQFEQTSMTVGDYRARLAHMVRSHKDAVRSTKGLNDNMRSLRRTMVNLTATYTAFSGVANIAQTGFQLEATESILEGVSGSSEAAAENMLFLRETARTFGIDIAQSGKGFGKLMAASKASNISLDDTRKLFLATSKASAAFGLTADESAGLMTAFQQVISKGQVMSEELN